MTTPSSFDLQPVLRGPTLKLRPLVESDFEPLYRAASDPLIWAQHPAPDRYQRPVFERFFADALASKGALLVEDGASGEVLGSSRYYDCNEDTREVTIGFTFLIRSRWGGAANRELKTLMLDHAFRRARTVWFHVGKDNLRSQKALAKIGARLSHDGMLETASGPQPYLYLRIDADAWRARNGGSGISVDIRRDDLRGAEIAALLQEHLDEMYAVSPPESVHALDLDGLRKPDITFWSAWIGTELAGCGALKTLSSEHGEIKSMRTARTHQRKGVAAALLRHILDEARRRGLRQLSLETGSMAYFDPARRLYESFGFEDCEPFAEYVPDPNSVFMTKVLD